MEDVFIDPRDGNVYKTVEIGNQIWLVENLRYAPGQNADNIIRHGCLYTWEMAIKFCPEGWHLPTKEEFENLLKASGDTNKECFTTLAARDWGGDDSVGFRALPSVSYYGGNYYNFGMSTYFWSATEYKYNSCYAYILGLSNGYANVHNIYKDIAVSVRCIKD